jgi:hypothetical protein
LVAPVERAILACGALGRQSAAPRIYVKESVPPTYVKESVMAIAANYIVVLDEKKRLGLPLNPGFTLKCPAPENTAHNWAPLLTFMVDSVGSLDEFKFKVMVTPGGTNIGTDVYVGKYSGRVYYCVQQVIPRNLLQPFGIDKIPASINFERQGGDGQIDISDVVVWVRVNA